jgi:geranylgeranyl reductase family protein
MNAPATPLLEGKSDVLIVGAGPTGCAAGIVAARAGADVCVIDRAVFARDKVCGDAVSNDGVQLLERLGARDAVMRGPHAIVRGAAAVFPDGTRIARDYDPPGYIVPRVHLDDCLRRALQAAGARLEQGRRVATLVREGSRVVGAEGPALRWSAQLVIAADGYGSVGLPAIGCPGPHGRALAVSATAYYRGVAFTHGAEISDHFFDRELPYGYGWIFPAVDGVANVGVYLRADAYARSGHKLDALLQAFIARRAERFAGAERVGDVRAWSLPLAPRRMPIAAPGLMLAGDAAGLIDPLTGEGIWQGLHSGVLAGEVAAAALRAGELNAALRRRYAQACQRDIQGPSRGKALAQRAMAEIVERRLYRSRVVRAALTLAYRGRALEMTKS